MSDLIVKDNVLINASYNLELTEQRLILLSIVRARETGTGISENRKLQIHASDYAERFNVTKEASYDALKNAVNNLFERKFSFKNQLDGGKESVTKSRWISEVTYIDHSAILEVIFAPAVVPLITRLELHFTSYELKQISKLTSKYAIRLYELLISWREIKKTPIFNIQDFREKLGLSESDYLMMSDFKKRVLDPAIKQINKETDITVEYQQHKTGRSITGLSFKFKLKIKDIKLAKICQKEGNLFCKISEKQIDFYASKLSKLHSLSDLAHTMDYSAFQLWIANILRNKDSVRQETAERIFKALHLETDFKVNF